MTADTVAETVAALTLEEKALLVEGLDSWTTHPIPRLGIPSITLTDGPHGVRLVSDIGGGFDITKNARSTAFPTSATVACSWDPEQAASIGRALGRESRDAGVHVLLGPGVNLVRSPLCGRNFEYFSEDPLIAGVFGEAWVAGVESEGVGTSLKHFAANSNEEFRFVGDSLVDERALRELYLRAFERIVRRARPATVMCAYNRVNGRYASEHRELLTGILREQWGFGGLVMTDWGATADRVAGVAAGCDLDMPGGIEHNRAAIVDAVRSGALAEADLDLAVARVLRLVRRTTVDAGPAPAPHDHAEHARLAAEVAAASAVLLHNTGVLPLSAAAADAPLMVVGDLFERMRFQGAGSSLITPTSVVSPKDAFDARGVRYRFERGYRGSDPHPDRALAASAIDAVTAGETVLFFGGLTDLEESEGFDRRTLHLGDAQVSLLRGLIDAGARVVVVLFAGAPVELPFHDELAAVLNMMLPGQHGGEATAALLFGEVEPSGRLATSWPLAIEDSSAYADYDRAVQARYLESIYVGYRWYDAAGTALRYPFGFGLGYTSFQWRDLAVDVVDGRVTVTATVHNTGDRAGAEVVQCYVGNNAGAVFKAQQELRAFAKVTVPAGGSARVELAFDLADLAYWDVRDHAWRLENGEYEVRLSASAADVRLRAPLIVSTGVESRSPYPAAVDREYARPPAGVPASFPALLGREVATEVPPRRLAMESRFVDARRSILGRLIGDAIVGRMRTDFAAAVAMPDSVERDARVKNANFLVRMMPFTSPRSLAMSSSGQFPYRVALGLDRLAAGHPIRGLRLLLGRASTVDEARRIAGR